MSGFDWIYAILLTITIGSIFIKNQERKNLWFCIGGGFLILLFVAKDLNSSLDLHEYLRQYRIIQDLPISEYLNHKFEIGYVLVNKLLSVLFEGERVLLIFVSLLIMVPYFRLFYKESAHPMISLMLFLALGFYSHALSLYRQFCAMAILTFSIRYIKEKKLLPFLLTVLLAMTFHKTAGAFILVYIGCMLPVNKWLLLAAMLGSALVGVFGQPILNLLNQLVTYPGAPAYDGGITLLAVLWTIVFISYWVLGYRMEEGRVRVPFIMLLIAAASQPIAFTFYMWARMALYFSCGMLLLLPELYDEVFCRTDNKVLKLLEKRVPVLHRTIIKIYHTSWFHAVIQIVVFAALYIWFQQEILRPYSLAPIS